MTKRNQYKKHTRDIRSAYHIYTILDKRNRNLYLGYTLNPVENEELLFEVEPDFLCSNIHQYMWQEGLEHFVYRTYALADAPPTCIQDKRDADFMKKMVIAQIHCWNDRMLRHDLEDRLPLVRINLLDDDITLEAKEVVVVPKESVPLGDIATEIVFEALGEFYE